MTDSTSAASDQPQDEHGYPICPRCTRPIAPGQSVLLRERLMRHVDCRLAGQIIREPDPPGLPARRCLVCREPIPAGAARYRRADGEVHLACDQRAAPRGELA
jgi:RNase P subunit RPR2